MDDEQELYHFVTVKLNGFIFFARNISHSVMLKNDLIRIQFPIHEDLNMTDISNGAITFTFNKSLGLFKYLKPSNDFKNVCEKDVVENYVNDNIEWFVDRGAMYMYVCVKKFINVAHTYIPAPTDASVYGASLIYNSENIVDENDMIKIKKIYDMDGEIKGISKDTPIATCDISITSSSGYSIISGLDNIISKNNK